MEGFKVLLSLVELSLPEIALVIIRLTIMVTAAVVCEHKVSHATKSCFTSDVTTDESMKCLLMSPILLNLLYVLHKNYLEQQLFSVSEPNE